MSDKSPEWVEKTEKRVERIENHARETLDEATALREDIEDATYPDASTRKGVGPEPSEKPIVGIDRGAGGAGSETGGTTDD